MANKPTYDIAIVGGGLAGLCLSIQAAAKGYSVVLLEKEQYPFHRVCGEYISNESRPFLERLGVPLTDWHLPEINTLHASDVHGNVSKFSLPLGGFGVSRFKLDYCLYEIALQNGVDVLTGWKTNDIYYSENCCTVTGINNTIKATVGVGCFGKRSNIDLKWERSFISKKSKGLNNYIGIKYHIKHPHEENVIALHNFKNGYCGISKIEDDKYCLCYLTTATNLRSHGHSIKQMEEELLYKNPFLKSIFSTATFLYDKPIAISQVSFSRKEQVENHILLAGDAAGMITPLCGNGMSMAMHGSKIAFDVINAFLAGKTDRSTMEVRYRSEWKNLFSSRLWMGRMVQQLFGGNQSTSLFFKAMSSFPSLATQLIKATHGSPF
jgi:flavin-dependent dehydrogenase